MAYLHKWSVGTVMSVLGSIHNFHYENGHMLLSIEETSCHEN